MLNYTLSTIFGSLAEMSKNKDGSFNTVMDFTRAARTIRDHTRDIGIAYSDGTLKALPGITTAIFDLIDEYFKTGKIKEYEELKEKYSEDLIKFIRISGLGRRRVFHIYDALEAKNIDDLKEAVSNGSIYNRIVEQSFVDKNFINKIHIDRFVSSLQYYENTKSLFPAGYAGFFIDSIKSAISEMPEVKRVQITGSLRRKKSFIRDIDIIVLPDFNKEIYDFAKSRGLLKRISGLGFIKKLISINKSTGNISAKYDTSFGIELEIIVSSQSGWHYDLFNTTGSKSHVSAIKKLADKKNIALENPLNIRNSYAKSSANTYLRLKETILKNKSFTPGPSVSKAFSGDFSDRPVYDLLGLEYIEPELRENKGELELAQEFKLPKLVRVQDIKGDLHIHSYWSDGLIDINELLEKCRAYNYSYFAITDHSASNQYGNGLSTEKLFEKMEYVEELRTRIKEPFILLGGEVDIIGKDRLDYSDDILKRIDFVLGAMHSNYLNTIDDNTERVVNAIKNKYVDAIAHPTGVVFGARAPYGFDMEKIFEAAIEYEKALEINSYLLRLDLNDEYVRQFKKMGGRFVIDTDSHRVDNIDMIKLGVDVARRAGLEKDDIINTMELAELRKWKNKRLGK